MENEVWKDIPNYEGLYQVSNLGRVKSLSRQIKRRYICVYEEKILKHNTNRGGYQFFVLCNENNKKTFTSHQLVAMAFLGHIPCGHKLVVDHINDIPSDNRVENLQIVTQRFNCKKTQGTYSSKYKGVSWDKSRKNGKRIFI